MKLHLTARSRRRREALAYGPRGGRQVGLLPHEALHLRQKLQKVTYSQKVEKWESDSDSDGSGDEQDLMV